MKLIIICFFASVLSVSLSAQKIIDSCFTSLSLIERSSIDFISDHRESNCLVLKHAGLIEWTGIKWTEYASGKVEHFFDSVPVPSYILPGRAINLGLAMGNSAWVFLKIRPDFFALKLDKPLEPGVEARFVFAYIAQTPILEPEIYSDSVPDIYGKSGYHDSGNDVTSDDMPFDLEDTAHLLGQLPPAYYKKWVIDTFIVNIPANIKNQNWLIIHPPSGEYGVFYNICSIQSPIKLELEKDIILSNVFFEIDKSDLLPTSFGELNQVVDYLKESISLEITINGYTDNIGTQENNSKLSEARAKAVAEYLISKGIAQNRVTYKGHGSTSPIASNATEEGRAKNRRVEFKITKK